jgi:GNAT superfamily N-acetyltransferase
VDINEAIEVFVHAFCRGKSRTYPYVAENRDGLWVMQDTPSRKDARKIEIVAHNLTPSQAVGIVAPWHLGRHFISHIHANEQQREIREEYKSLGYRVLATEWMFIHDLEDIPKFDCSPSVIEVPSQEFLDGVSQRAKQPRKYDADTRLFGIWNEEQDFGWVRSIPFGENAWVSALHVNEESRRNGYGRALMSALLRRDRECGVKTSVLLGTAAGSRLYPHLGYKQIATLQIFYPKL